MRLRRDVRCSQLSRQRYGEAARAIKRGSTTSTAKTAPARISPDRTTSSRSPVGGTVRTACCGGQRRADRAGRLSIRVPACGSGTPFGRGGSLVLRTRLGTTRVDGIAPTMRHARQRAMCPMSPSNVSCGRRSRPLVVRRTGRLARPAGPKDPSRLSRRGPR